MTIETITDIPDPVPMTGWKDVIIIDCQEPLSLLNNIDPRIFVDPQYFKQNIPQALDQMYLRKSAAERLVKATDLLPNRYSLIIFDAFRPLSVQQSLFDTFKNLILEESLAKGQVLSKEEISERVQRYVSLPSDNPTRPSPHATGGAVDLSILDSNGRLLDMGTEFDSFEPNAGTAYFKGKEGGEVVHRNRNLLYHIMARVGFTNYPEEWWHFDYGNQFWGYTLHRPAIYGLYPWTNLREI